MKSRYSAIEFVYFPIAVIVSPAVEDRHSEAGNFGPEAQLDSSPARPIQTTCPQDSTNSLYLKGIFDRCFDL